MANEISVTATLQYTNPAVGVAQKTLSLVSALFNITGKNYVQGTVSATTGGIAVPLAGLANAGWALFLNHDATNYVNVLTAAAGTVFGKMLPGEVLLMRFDSSVTAPALQAHTAACEVEYLILEA